ncbi:MAG: C4-dicarboxylate ABC transporter, partial [Paracoccaceae bacterium]
MDLLIEILPGLMFGSLILALFSGLPVAIMLMGVTLIFGAIAVSTGEMRFVQLTLLPNRIYGGIVQ